MSWDPWSVTKRIGMGVATGGLSEAGGARPVLDAAAGDDYTKNLLFGGQATKGIDAAPPQYDAVTAQLGQMASTAQGRAAPSFAAAQLDGNPQNQSRQGMMDVAGRLGGIASGMAPGAGEIAVNRQLGAANAAQNSAARMARGPMSALVYRAAMRNQADMGLAGAGRAAEAQLQDQTAANQTLTGLYGTMRGQDIGLAGDNAQLSQQANMANQSAQLTQTQMNDARQIQALGMQLGWDQAKIQAELAKAGIAMNDKGILPGLIQGAGQAGAAYATGGLSMAGGAGGAGRQNPATLMDNGGLMTMSDVRNKTDIAPGGAVAERALAALAPSYTFGYRDPQAYGSGPQFGVMAQDLERNPGLAHTVIDTPHGKAIDGGKLTTANTALIGELAAKTRALEEDARRKNALLAGVRQAPLVDNRWQWSDGSSSPRMPPPPGTTVQAPLQNDRWQWSDGSSSPRAAPPAPMWRFPDGSSLPLPPPPHMGGR